MRTLIPLTFSLLTATASYADDKADAELAMRNMTITHIVYSVLTSTNLAAPADIIAKVKASNTCGGRAPEILNEHFSGTIKCGGEDLSRSTQVIVSFAGTFTAGKDRLKVEEGSSSICPQTGAYYPSINGLGYRITCNDATGNKATEYDFTLFLQPSMLPEVSPFSAYSITTLDFAQPAR